MEKQRPLALIILDGWGYSPNREGNAIVLANTPNYDHINHNYPVTFLSASGEKVGLSPDIVGNSEVGHLNLGLGRTIRSGLAKINYDIEKGLFGENKVLKVAMKKAQKSSLHLIGLLSDGNVHSSPEHLFALLRMAKKHGVKNVFVHATLDGRDVPPDSADIYVEALEIKMNDIGCGKIATLCGRQWTMDNSNHWERTARAYTMLAHAEGERAFDAVTAIRGNYLRGILDEQIQPIVLESEENKPVATLQNDDVVVFFNHRGDRLKQLVEAVAFTELEEVSTIDKPQVHVVCLTDYEPEWQLSVAFPDNAEPVNGLAQIFAEKNIPNCRLTETEKYSHVTYFFNGGTDVEYSCEQRVLVQTPKDISYENQPEMASFKITDKLLRGLENNENQVFIVNFPSPEALANTGNLEKTIEAIQHVDTCLGGILEKIQELNGIALITSTHGNCEEMLNPDGEVSISPTSNAVPFHLIDDTQKAVKLREDGALEDVAPTILALLNIEKPLEMTGKDLRII